MNKITKGESEVTIYDVAKALGISPSTVSRALNDHPHIRKDTKRKIKNKAQEMGYQRNKFASNLRQQHTHTIGVVVPRLDSYFMSSVISGMEKITHQHGYNLIICQSQESLRNEISAVNTLYSNRVDGLLVSLAAETKNLDHFKNLFEKGIPVIFFDRNADNAGTASIVIDNRKAGYDAVSHLIAEGCCRILHVGGNMERNVYEHRFAGYRQALAEHDIPFDEDLLLISNLSDHAGVDVVSYLRELKQLPDGIFASNDAAAVSIICELKRAGYNVPGDIAVAGFNNDPNSRVVEPNLTTVHYPGSEMGELAALTLISRLESDRTLPLSTVVLKHELIVRESSLRKINHPVPA
jgi:LacI family transcriptional regulator